MEEDAVWNRWKEVATEGMRGGGAGKRKREGGAGKNGGIGKQESGPRRCREKSETET